jgi:hypothetical protein
VGRVVAFSCAPCGRGPVHVHVLVGGVSLSRSSIVVRLVANTSKFVTLRVFVVRSCCALPVCLATVQGKAAQWVVVTSVCFQDTTGYALGMATFLRQVDLDRTSAHKLLQLLYSFSVNLGML